MYIWVSTPDLGAFCSKMPSQTTAEPDAYFQRFDFNTSASGDETPLWKTTEASSPSSAEVQALNEGLEIQWDDTRAYESYHELFHKLLEQIDDENIQKLVGTVGFEGCIPGIEKLWSELAQNFLLQLKKTEHRFFQHLVVTEDAIQVGCSPELLFQKSPSKHEVKTVALAGTASSDEAPELLKDPKNLQEHDWVIQSLRAQSESWAELAYSGPEIADLQNGLCHLKSRVTLTPTWPAPPENMSQFLVEKLHPTAALGSFPPNAIALPDLYSGTQDRGQFGGPMVLKTCRPEMNSDEIQSWVNIRSLRIQKDGRVFFPVGAGLVKQSRFKNEWGELLRKRASLLTTLGFQMPLPEEHTQ